MERLEVAGLALYPVLAQDAVDKEDVFATRGPHPPHTFVNSFRVDGRVALANKEHTLRQWWMTPRILFRNCVVII